MTDLEIPHHLITESDTVREGPPRPVIRVALCQDNQIKQGGIELIDLWDRNGQDKIWIDILGLTREEIEPLLEARFGFHELAAEDSLSPNTLPKYDPFPDYDFFIFRAINLNVADHKVDTLKLAAFLGRNFLFTVYQRHMISTDTTWTRLPQDRRMIDRGCDFLLYSILDVLVDQHFPLIDRLEERVDEIHESIFAETSPVLLDELLHLKRDLNVLRRSSLPQRELFNQISRGDAEFISEQHLIYYRDLYDHMFRISESIDVERDLIAGTMEAYLSMIANRTNDIMMVLTIFSAIILPVNLIASIYGMNFEHMPELRWRFGYLWAFGLMAVVSALMLVWFNRKGWLFPHRRHRRPRLERRRGASGESLRVPDGPKASLHGVPQQPQQHLRNPPSRTPPSRPA